MEFNLSFRYLSPDDFFNLVNYLSNHHNNHLNHSCDQKLGHELIYEILIECILIRFIFGNIFNYDLILNY